MKRTPLARVSTRTDRVITFACIDCGQLVQRVKRGAGFCRNCSQRRNGIARSIAGAEANARAREAERVPVTCQVCGTSFDVPPSRAQAKVCSRKCAGELKRRRGGAWRRGVLNPAYKDGARAGAQDQEIQARWRRTMSDRCDNPRCPGNGGRLSQHHVVYRQHVHRAGGDDWDPANGITLCNRCHAEHHGQARKLPISALPLSALHFGFALFGSSASLYFRRYYRDDGDPRLEDIAPDYVGR